MSRFSKVLLIAAVVTMVGAGAVTAQTVITTEVKQGTVVHVYGNNLVVKMADGTTKEFDVQEGFMFDIDGVPTAVKDLKPGTQLTSEVKVTEEVHVVQTEEIRKGKVVRTVGQTVIIRRENGEIVKFHEVPEDIVLTSDGKPVTLWDLREGMNITATIISTREEIVDERQVQVAGTAPKAAPKPAPAPTPVPYTAPALPSTGSQLPLVGLTGLLMIVIGLGIGIIRRF